MRYPSVSCRSFAAALLLAFAPAPASAEVRYAVTPLLPTHTGPMSYAAVKAIDDTGRAVGWQASSVPFPDPSPNGVALARPVLWDAGATATALPVPANATRGVAVAINNVGLAVGYTQAGTTGPTNATTFTATAASDLPKSAPTAHAAAFAVNDAGVIGGSDDGVPFVFRDGTRRSLVRGGSSQTTVTDLSLGQGDEVFGTWRATPFTTTARIARLRTDAPPTFLTPDADFTAVNVARAFGINRHNEVAGTLDPQGTGTSAYAIVVTAAGVTRLPTGDGVGWGNVEHAFRVAQDVNDRGVVVGRSRQNLNQRESVAYISSLSGGLPIALDALIVTDRPTHVGDAVAINNRGQIVANGFYDHDGDAATAMRSGAMRLDPIRTAGDTDYDGAVGFPDLLNLAASYGRTGNGVVFWETGDFDFDWDVDFADLLTLASNYGTPGTFAADWAAARATVPEPATMLGAAALLAAGSRRMAGRRCGSDSTSRRGPCPPAGGPSTAARRGCSCGTTRATA